MRSDIIKRLIEAHSEGDNRAFRKAALQLAAAESSAGHSRIADDIRRQIAALPLRHGPDSVVDIARPRGELAEILEGGHRRERLGDLILSPEKCEELEKVLHENRSRAALERHGLSPRRRLLFHGPPGCGKTLAATVIAGEMGLPLLTLRLASLFSRFLGATANHLCSVFDEMPRRPGVYLFDEFDAIAQARGESQDVGEMRRVVTAFLQFMDADQSPSLLIAATNHPELLDRAVFRRFDVVLAFSMPDEQQLRALIRLRLRSYTIAEKVVDRVAPLGAGLSFADLGRACDDALRTMVLDGREEPTLEDLEGAFTKAQQRAHDQQRARGR
ncbi:ATP-dependent zinc metalloprotease FtsH [Enhygromyxa salina]|uniref:ATP-dependent zinc metalloprotease FtsH n=1 Tax=Enhygromyxa salina TaxID=215803 RepID=A0A2S9XRJ1_9BACT|nr:ATP-binding protein [Enhygromyxa salina]PRP95475.1 ATP-dependent zinc metalloprotease FtsH [Enhygromyxa salina]